MGEKRVVAQRLDAQRPGTLRILTAHFFRRFFDNDTVQPEGDTQTTVVRALSFVAAPGLMIAFFIQAGIGIHRMGMWGGIEVRCFFVVYSFVVMGAVTVFEWQMLFPDKLDFLVLTPLPVRRMQMFVAKAAALAGFLGLFVVAANIFATILLSGSIGRPLAAHVIATLGAGIFAALLFLAIGGTMLCVLSGRMVRVISPVVQMLAVMALLLVLFACLRFTGSIPILLQQQPLGPARWLPPLWFLGLYEEILEGSRAPAFAPVMAGYAWRGLAIVAGVVVVTYPLAWARVRKMTIEGVTRGRGRRTHSGVGTALVRRPGERAVFHFIGQTLARNNRYQVYMAIYCGAGLALAVNFAVSLRVVGHVARLELSDSGLHAVMPMLVFWTVAGLRTAFAFPVNLQAGWIFRVTGVDLSECAAAGRRWVTACAGAVLAGVLAVQGTVGWNTGKLLVQAVCGGCLCLLLSDGFFFVQRSVPFNQARMPGQVSFPLMLTLYIGVYPLYVEWMGRLEIWLERHPQQLATACFLAAALHWFASWLRGLSSEAEDLAEYDGEFQVLGLTVQ